MARKPKLRKGEPTQRTATGLEIPIPNRRNVVGNIKKVLRAAPSPKPISDSVVRIDARDFGVKADGRTNDTAAFQAAVNFAVVLLNGFSRAEIVHGHTAEAGNQRASRERQVRILVRD
jgi:hypothetical protein